MENVLTKEQLLEFIRKNNIQSVSDIYESLKDLFKSVLQSFLEAEIEETLGYEKYDVKNKQTTNSRNGYTQKTVKTKFGEMEIDIPRDREGEFEPKIIPKYKRDISEIEDKIIALYSRAIATRDIHEQIKDIYGIEVSAEMVSKITEKIIPEIREWQNRPLEKIYPFIFMDAIHYKIKDEGRIVNKAAYVVLGINIEGYKDVLGIWIGESESSKFWLGVLNDLKTRGVEEVLLFCVDGLTGLKEAIEAVFPKSDIQRCIIHQLRNSFKYVSYKHIKEFSKDFKKVYQATNEEEALENFYQVKEKWGKQYPYAFRSWESNWDSLTSFFKFPPEIRKIIYTTNIIEGVHRQFRKVTKEKSVFPNDTALEKMLYLATKNVVRKWTQRYRNWDIILNQLLIMYPERLSGYIN